MKTATATPTARATVVPILPKYKASAPSFEESRNNTSLDRSNVSLNEKQIQQLLQQGYTKGLAMSIEEMKQLFALRIWIVDNSGSMRKMDGHRIISSTSNANVKIVPSSRWDEIVECVEYHIKMAGLIEAPTRFRFLNNPGAYLCPQQFSIAEDLVEPIPQQVQNATQILRRARPGGCTPLRSHVLEIHDEVTQMAPTLRRLGKKVVIVIATDGLPTDERVYGGSFVDALRMLEGLPVWVVVRLCTDDEDVVNFYNELDGQLELSIEVLDDFTGEAVEVTTENPWLNYTLPLHRLREFGFHDRVFDMLDERALTKSEVRDFCVLLFGRENFDGVSDPSLDWDSFAQDIARLLGMEAHQYDPVNKKVAPLISMRKLNRMYGNSACSPDGCAVM
eukprot:scaffold1772_cov80-Cylindrotheca_fusiformis.AAC.16